MLAFFAFLLVGSPAMTSRCRNCTICAVGSDAGASDVYKRATGIEDEQNGLLDPHTGELFVPAGLLASRPPES